MAKALGVGGIFFKSKDPQSLMKWYQATLGVPAEGGEFAPFMPDSMPAGACTVFSAFKDGSDYFAPSDQRFMVNLVVDDLDGALRQVASAGGTLAGEPTNYDYGRFGWFLDPDGNKVELWEPAAPAA